MTAERVKHIEPSKTVELTARIAELKRQGEKVIGLNVGEPDFVTPPHICAAANQALKEGFTKYTPVMGILPLREAICRNWKGKIMSVILRIRLPLEQGQSNAFMLL